MCKWRHCLPSCLTMVVQINNIKAYGKWLTLTTQANKSIAVENTKMGEVQNVGRRDEIDSFHLSGWIGALLEYVRHMYFNFPFGAFLP